MLACLIACPIIPKAVIPSVINESAVNRWFAINRKASLKSIAHKQSTKNNAFSLLLVPVLPLNQLGEGLICLTPDATASALGYASIGLRLLTRAVACALCSAHDQIAAIYPRWEQYCYNQHAKVTQLWIVQLTFWV
jgi:hypothetical protein